MQWVLAFHVIFVVCWFAGLFYLPRLYVYHAMTEDAAGIARFKVMERKLYYGITLPSGVLATGFGLWYLLTFWSHFSHVGWMQAKLVLVFFLWVFHGFCQKYLSDFKHDRNKHSHVFYRYFNEVPVFFLISILLLAFLQPSF